MGCGSCSTGGCPSIQIHDWLGGAVSPRPPRQLDVVEVQFKNRRAGFYRNARFPHLQTGDFVIVEAERGMDFGTVTLTGELVRLRLRKYDTAPDGDFPRILRPAVPDEIEKWEKQREKEAETFSAGREIIGEQGLEMKLMDVEWQFDGARVTFYFTADKRVDFRELVRLLARRFRTRVELRQIGPRDAAARTGGIGSCGRELCCSTFLHEFQPVSTSAAKVQNLPLNPARLSGQCGRLKCCLNYELEQYMTMLSRFPKVDMPIQIPQGKGRIEKLDIFRDLVWVRLEEGGVEQLSLEASREALSLRDADRAAPARPVNANLPAPTREQGESRRSPRKDSSDASPRRNKRRNRE